MSIGTIAIELRTLQGEEKKSMVKMGNSTFTFWCFLTEIFGIQFVFTYLVP